MRPICPSGFSHASRLSQRTAPRADASALFVSVSTYQRCKRLRTLHEYMYMWGRYTCIISCSLIQKCRQGGQATKPQLTGPSSSSCSSVSVTTAFAPQIRNTVSVTRPSKQTDLKTVAFPLICAAQHAIWLNNQYAKVPITEKLTILITNFRYLKLYYYYYYYYYISLMKRLFVVTHTIRKSEIPALLDCPATNAPSVKMLCPQKKMFVLMFS
jgi:hypothetical protein